MKKLFKTLLTGVVMALLAAGVPGCQKEGPAERAGKQIDQSVEKGGEKVQEAGKEVQKSAEGQE